MLEFVGLGLYDERSITQRGAEALASADAAFLEGYTSVLAGADVSTLQAHHGRTIPRLDRATIEQRPDDLLDRAESEHVVLLVGGDPMIATTHVDLRLRAADRDIPTSIVHGTSAATAAAGLCGLQARRFGKATTVPFPGALTDEGVPRSVVETVDDNRERGLHTLVYLDIDVDGAPPATHEEMLGECCLDAGTAAEALAHHRPALLAIVVARAGSDEPQVHADRLERLAGGGYGPPLHVLVIPGRLHDLEAAALRRFAGAPAGVVAEMRD